MPELTTGDPAPAFHIPAVTRSGETEIALSDYLGKSSVVLYFYPKDDTPGCTIEACNFRDLLPQFEAAGSTILGISPDDQASMSRSPRTMRCRSRCSLMQAMWSRTLTESGKKRPITARHTGASSGRRL